MHAWHIRDRILTIGRRPLVMGIVNVTPDSFSDGGQFLDPTKAIEHGLGLIQEGADILDIGGESTRPGSLPVLLEQELGRVVPVIEGLARASDIPLSVDTSKAEVAKASFAAGAHIVNDVTAFTGDARMIDVARDFGAGVILMHMQGTPAIMQQAPRYGDVVAEILAYLRDRAEDLMQAGIVQEKIAIDPGIGFGKTHAHNMELLRRLREFQSLGHPLCLGVSRKGTIAKALDKPQTITPQERLAGGLAIVCHAQLHGAAQIVRVHDVAATCDAVVMMERLVAAELA